MQPTIRNANGDYSAATWNEALQLASTHLKNANGDVAAIAGSSMTNEDLWTLRQLVKGLGSERLGAWPPTHAGADLVEQVGVGKGTNLTTLGAGDAVLVIASDLEEEAPIWGLHVKKAQDNGANVVVANARHTRMDDFASAQLRFDVGEAAGAMQNLRPDNAEIAQKLAEATNLVVIAGAEGLSLEGSRALMQAAANFLIETKHVGKAQNGLLSTFPGANGMGLHYMGFSPAATVNIVNNPPKVLIIAQADVMADDPSAAEWLSKVETIICLSLFPDGATQMATAALPIQSFAERDGTFTNGERRVQRFYTAQGPMGDALPAWHVIARLGEILGQGRPKASAAAVMLEITQLVPAFAGMRYNELAKVERQFPDVGGEDLYYGGTAYSNTGGLGVQAPTAADAGDKVKVGKVKLPEAPAAKRGSILVVPTVRLYNHERVFEPSSEALMRPRVAESYVDINAADAKKLKVKDGDMVQVTAGNTEVRVRARVNGAAPEGAVLLPRHLAETASPLTITAGQVSKVSELVVEG
jgi:NADH-quinone oxidoreductase subunit G